MLLSAAHALQVEIVHDGSRGLTWSNLAVPLLTLVGGIVGVVVGARLSRRTLVSVEDQRATKDDALEDRREARRLNVERRHALGVIRVLASQLEERQVLLCVSMRQKLWWPEGHRAALQLRPEDEHRLASWLGEHAWEVLANLQASLLGCDGHRDFLMRGAEDELPTLDADQLDDALSSIDEMRTILIAEERRLKAESEAILVA